MDQIIEMDYYCKYVVIFSLVISRLLIHCASFKQHFHTYGKFKEKWSCDSSEIRFRRGAMHMEFDTFVDVSSSFEARCSLAGPIPPDATNKYGQALSLSDYMRLPVDQYVCIKMPLDAVLERDTSSEANLDYPYSSCNRFILTVPPGISVQHCIPFHCSSSFLPYSSVLHIGCITPSSLLR